MTPDLTEALDVVAFGLAQEIYWEAVRQERRRLQEEYAKKQQENNA